jgi:hypothetical protein
LKKIRRGTRFSSGKNQIVMIIVILKVTTLKLFSSRLLRDLEKIALSYFNIYLEA